MTTQRKKVSLHTRFLHDWCRDFNKGVTIYDGIRLKYEHAPQFQAIKKVLMYMYDFGYTTSVGSPVELSEGYVVMPVVRTDEANDIL